MRLLWLLSTCYHGTISQIPHKTLAFAPFLTQHVGAFGSWHGCGGTLLHGSCLLAATTLLRIQNCDITFVDAPFLSHFAR